MKKKHLKRLVAAAALAGALTPLATRAGETLIDFNTDPTGLYTLYGVSQWAPSGGKTGGSTDGYFSVTDALNSQAGVMVFDEFEPEVVKSFTLEADLRIGGGTDSPADGFSINFARLNDPVVETGTGFAANLGNEGNLPEEGTTTGLAIGFDAWNSGSGDIIGLSIRVDNVLLSQIPMPVLNGALENAQSLQTGPQNPNRDDFNPDEPSWKLLGWAPLKVVLSDDGKVSVTWKNALITPEGGIQTTFFPSRGRIVFAGRTGGANQNHHVDNLKITTTAASLPTLTGLSGGATGFSFDLTDAGASSVVPASITAKLGGQPVTLTSVAKNGGVTTGRLTIPLGGYLAPGSVQSVEISALDSNNNSVVFTREFTVPNYSVLNTAAKVASANTPGFKYTVHQMDAGRPAANGDVNSIIAAELQFRGKVIDPLTGQPYANVVNPDTLPAGGVISGIINFNQDAFIGELGNFTSISTPTPYFDAEIPGIPGFTTNPDAATDNIVAEFWTYLDLPAGYHRFGVNSDDGFRVTVGRGARSVLASNIGEFNGGRGSSDTLFDFVAPEAGLYSFRLLWWEGGGGANVEFFSVNLDTGVKTPINAPGTSVKAFATSADPTYPYVNYVSPLAGSTGVAGTAPIVVELKDGSVAVASGTVKLSVNGAEVSANVVKTGTTTTATYDPGLLPSGAVLTVSIAYSDTASPANSYSSSFQFTVANYVTLPAAIRTDVGTGRASEPGFVVRISQVEGNPLGATINTLENDNEIAEGHLAGGFGPNIADLSQATAGVFNISDIINFNQDSPAGAGNFTETSNPPYLDLPIPGIPGTLGGLDNIAGEFKTYVEFPTAGYYTMGVNSDDGFRVIAGHAPTRQFVQVERAGQSPAALGAIYGGTDRGSIAAPLGATQLIRADVVYVSSLGCAVADITEDLTGKIAVINRGTCTFAIKILSAQAKGAVAALIVNNDATTFPIRMGGDGTGITIPASMINKASGTFLAGLTAGSYQISMGFDTAPRLGEFSGGRGASDTLFGLYVAQAGVYPIRMTWQEGGGGANVEWFSVTSGGTKIPLNATATGALKTFRSRTAEPNPTPTISIVKAEAGSVITFVGTLQSSDTVDGAYADVAGATSPYTVPGGTTAKFYRARN